MAAIRLSGQLRQLAGQATLTVDATTVAQALVSLQDQVPTLRGWILDERSVLRPHLNLFVNGRQADVATALNADSVLYVLPSITGGSHE